MGFGEVRVLEPGLLTIVQDAVGRPGLGRFGIPPGGAMDARAARLANRLVGNDGNEAVLEITLQGPSLVWTTAAHIGLAGADLGATTDGRSLVPGHSYRLGPGATLAFDRARAEGADPGVRAYLAVEGGFAVDAVLGSTSTDYRSGFGGIDGRPLRAGGILRFAADQTGALRSAVEARLDADTRIAFIPSPASLGWFAPSAVRTFCGTAWTVAPDSDRSGIRLAGGTRLPSLTAGIPSLGVPVGAVQVPPSGAPIVKMVDGPVTGGYPAIGVVPRFDLARLAQAAPGAELRFRRVSIAAARARAIDDLERVELDEGDFAAAWAR